MYLDLIYKVSLYEYLLVLVRLNEFAVSLEGIGHYILLGCKELLFAVKGLSSWESFAYRTRGGQGYRG